MRLRYYRKKVHGKFDCCCDSDHVNDQGVSIVSCLLTDDGGLGREHSVAWVEQGVAMIDEVRSGETSSCSWDREAWGAKIAAHGVTIYSHHDDSWTQEVSLSSFREVLATWREFLLEGETSLESTREVDLIESSSESGRREDLTPAPHTTGHTDP